ncbi:carboxylate-amine ligase [Mesobaculum littorinae]|uniref:Putative glutamate--cysteine ligase 2 n=1 Tax=Mesobaculum littorinae TaxID=2486419 RepID=A0A438ALC6_9RHOB|nr:carboxylate-amine ligase [Mesobaculum littorinae]RVV99472.1 carboxylate-amine ligase [Mesobaculum littorinae]
MPDPDFTLGIEEEYLAIDPGTMELAAIPEAMFRHAKDRLGSKVSPEFRDCMIEIGTGVCRDIGEAREDLAQLRRGVAEVAEDHGLAIIAASCHPFSDPASRATGQSDRYDAIAEDIGGIARRLMTCGMHVHVGLGDDPELRVDLMQQFTYFLPLVLGLSASSPFWKGEDTMLQSWRLNVFDSVPRTGLPPKFDSWSDYRRTVDVLVENEIVEDATKIWWDLRPSEAWPTLETRIADVMPRVEEALSVAAFIQSAMAMLWRLKQHNQRWRIYDRFLVEENRWRAQRYGTAGTLLDLGQRKLRPFAEIVAQLVEEMETEAAWLGCLNEVRGTMTIAEHGSSARRQRAVHDRALADSADPREALRAVVGSLAQEFREGL